MNTPDSSYVAEVLDRFVEDTVGVEDALVVSADGVGLARSDGLPAAVAEPFGAITAGLVSLTRGAARCFADDRAERVVIELANNYLLVSEVTAWAVLGVVARTDADIGLVAYEMSLVGERLAPELSAELVTEMRTALSV